MSRLRNWEQAFDLFITQQGPRLGPASLRGIAQLRMLRNFLDINLRLWSPPLPLSTLATVQDAIELQRLWSESIEFGAIALSNPWADTTMRTYVPDIAVVHLLFAIVRHCAHEATRKQALALLKTAERQEGLWHSGLTLAVAERFLTLIDGKDGDGKGETAALPGEDGELSDAMRIIVSPDAEESSLHIQYGRGDGALRETLLWT